MAVIADWITNWKNVYQQAADAKYADDLKVYEQNRTDWVVNNIRNREQGIATTPPPTIPKRKVWNVAPNGVSLTEELVQDPAISNPVLPPPPAPSATPIVTTANATQDGMLAMLGGILQMLAELKAAVAELKAK